MDVMTRPTRTLAAMLVTAGLFLAGVALASEAQSIAATKVTPSLTFAGTGTSQTITTKVAFTSGYTGAYYVQYDIWRSTSSKKTSPVRMTTTTLSQAFTTTKALSYTTATTTKSCPPNATRTTYYYWLQGSVSDGGSGIVAINSPVVTKVACTSVF